MIKIALAGNPNSGKTTLFNSLTGSNQYVGNWPGVTVEKKEGKLKGNNDVIIVDLPGVYSLSPYTLEEVVARDFLINERPDVILNIVDGTNIERNLYLTTQLRELGIPIVIAINMMDVVRKNGDEINIKKLSSELGCKVVEISALKDENTITAAQLAIDSITSGKIVPYHIFSGVAEHAFAHIEEATIGKVPESQQRWYSIKIFERDVKVMEQLNFSEELKKHIEEDIVSAEKELDDDAESIVTNDRYNYITSIIDSCHTKKNKGKLSISDKIDKVVTNRIAALPIFAIVMFIVYYVSITTVGTWATDWANDGVFGNGWRLFGIGTAAYEQAVEEYAEPQAMITYFDKASEASGIDPIDNKTLSTKAYIYDDDGNIEKEITVTHTDYLKAKMIKEPNPADFGIWITGIPTLLQSGLEKINTNIWLQSLILDGIVAGVGAVLGFVPQMLILFLFLAFLESCGYMARIAFIMDRVFSKFGLSGKSFIPILIGTGCGVPGIMASRTIENDNDRKMTIITTTFIPCGAKLPVIALIAGAMFGGAWWVASSAYFLGIFSILVSGVMLKKTKLFKGKPAPFVMELPAYHMPTIQNLLRSMWERGWSFIKKAGTIILLASIIIWIMSNFGFVNGKLEMVDMNTSILAFLGNIFAPIFAPLGWGTWQGTVATFTGIIAKENVVGTLGVLFGSFGEVSENGWEIWDNLAKAFTPLAAFSFLVFNLLCAPCVAAMGAIKREMNNWKWTCFAILYQCIFAYVIALIVYQLGLLFTVGTFGFGTIVSIILVVLMLFMLFKPVNNKSIV